MEFVESTVEAIVIGLPVKIHRSPLVVLIEAHKRTPWDASTLGDFVFAFAASKPSERFPSVEKRFDVNMEALVVADLESAGRAASPRSGTLCSADAGLDSLEFLLVFDLGEIAHDVGDHGIDRLLKTRIVDVDREANIERFDSGLMFETVLDEPMDLAGPESREPREFVNDHEIVLVGLDGIAEVTVLLAALFAGPGDDVRVHVDVLGVRELRGDVFAALVELSLDFLILGADAGVDGG